MTLLPLPKPGYPAARLGLTQQQAYSADELSAYGEACALAERERLRAALEWYGNEAKALAKHMARGAQPQAVFASVTVLALDAGQRAAAAIRSAE